jgi:hypothetical protein
MAHQAANNGQKNVEAEFHQTKLIGENPYQ